MKLFLHEIKSNYKSLVAWIAAILFLQLSGYTKFEGFKSTQDGSSISNISNSFPKALKVLFGMNDLNIATLIGYFGILYFYFALIAAICSGLLGAGIISKEERDKTSEFLFTKPVSRSSVLTSKIFAGLLNVLIIFFVISISSIIGVGITNGGNYSLSPQVMNLMWGILLFQLLFFSLGVLFAGIFKNPKLPTMLVTVVIMVTFFASVLADLTSKLEWLKYLTPFKWFSAPDIITNGHISYSYSIIALALTISFFIISYISYNKRDLTVG